MKCKDCKWWKCDTVIVPKTGEYDEYILELDSGTCHYDPPATDGWPKANNDDFCSEFTQK